ncbi:MULTISPECIES: oxidoreductase [unclassified Micromonospora]|uniref:oxidoreductase n=1 Tax=unclassified Micromonospora TaxID=2617518 RepID=UPI002FF42C75
MTVVLITGCSSGIGRATAQRLLARGCTVYATARRIDSIADLAAAGCHTLALDVTDEESMTRAVAHVEAAHGAIDVLVNNAGYGEYGVIEEADLDRVRAQFETKVFGLARLSQLVLPAMRRQGGGRIINVGSMGGRLVFPGGGYYHASKYAVEAITDALRFEAAPFGVQVSLIEPGLIRTGFGDTAAGTLAGSAVHSGPYATLNKAVDESMARGYANRTMSAPPEAVARAIDHAATARRPRARYVVTAAAKIMVHTRRLLGARVFDAFLRTQFPGR